MILIFHKKSLLVYFIAILLNFFNCKVLITSPFKSFFLRQLEKLGLKIQHKSIIYLEISSQNIKNAGVIDGDFNQVTNKCVNSLCKRVDIISDLDLFFPNVKNLQKKLKLFVYETFDQLFFSQQQIITWLKSSIYKDSIIINFSSLEPGAKRIWHSSDLKVFFIFNYLIFFVGRTGSALFVIINYLFRLCYSKCKIIKNNNKSNNLLQSKNFNQNNILFFPHRGILKYGIPPKDHFYSNSINSKFHPSKIIHLEYDKMLNIELEKEAMKKYFKTNFICYNRFTNTHIPWSATLHFVIKIFSKVNLFNYKNLGNNILYYLNILKAFVIYKRCCFTLGPYKHAKIALVGYEILFPKALTLALETFGIKTIAITERSIVGFTNNYTFSVDTLLSVSSYTSNVIKKSDRFQINKILPVGQVRTDHLFNKKKPKPKNIKKSKFSKKVLILDHHIENNFENQKFSPILNWKNDISFRNQILSLAEIHPKIKFIFRGKNCDWLTSRFHENVVAKAKRLPNVSVDTDYSLNYWKSYHLCAAVDLIIARPTSLAEECISKGLDVIVMDYGINYRTCLSKFLPKLLRKYYCHSFDELNERFNFWKKHKHIVRKDFKTKIKKQIFSNLTDGKVKLRIQNYLKEII